MKKSPYLYTILRVAPLGVSTLGTLALARQLGINEFGRYAAAAAFAQIVVAVGLFGQDQLVMQGRLTPRDGLRRSGATVAFSMSASIALGLAMLPSGLYPALVLISAATAVVTWVGVMLIYAQHGGNDIQRASLDLGMRVSTQGLSNGLASVWSRATIGALGNLTGACVAALFVALRFRAVAGEWRPQAGMLAARFRDGFSFGLVGLLYSVTLVVPPVVVAANGDSAANAFTRIVILWYSAITAVGSATCGEFFRVRLYAAHGRPERRKIWLGMRQVLTITSPAFAVLTLIAALVTPVALGRHYAPVGGAIALLALDVVPQFMSIAFGSLLMSNGYTLPNISRHAGAFVFTLVACLTISPLTPAKLAGVLITNDVLAVIWYRGTRARWGIDDDTDASPPMRGRRRWTGRPGRDSAT